YRTESRRATIRASIRNVDRRADVRLTVNGYNTNDFEFNNLKGRLSANVDLREGRNTVVIMGRNEAGEDQDDIVINYEPYVAPPRVEPPVVTITNVSEPTANAYRPNECTSVVTATILNVESRQDINFLVNGQRNTNFSFDARRKVLRSDVRLTRERNQIVVEARNAAGSHRDEARANCYSRPKVEAPVVRISSPQNGSTTATRNTAVRASIRNVERQQDIRFYLNGRPFSQFNFDRRSGQLSATVELIDGENNIRISAENEGGSDEASVRINYRGQVVTPRQHPVVDIIDPNRDRTVQKATASFRATTKHVARKADVTFSVNGRNTSNFNFSAISREITATINLKEGRNTIVVRVNNRHGNDQDSRVITYEKPVVQTPKPIVDITSPANNSTTDKNRAVIKATVRNATSKEIKLNVNGKVESYFQLKGNQLTANVGLRKGSNQISITATTKGGTAKDETRLYYRVATVAPPEVSFTAPSAKRKVFSTARLNVKALLENVAGKSDITFELNGRPVNNFEFDADSKELSASVTLKAGVNTLFLEGSNKGGTDVDEMKVTYRRSIQTPTTKDNDTKTTEEDISKPTIEILSVGQPVANPFNPNAGRSTVLANITSVKSTNGLSLTIDGKASSD
ncbi:MAG: hypothetical protein AAFO94_13275, partial [Bacteroidota bacterium]